MSSTWNGSALRTRLAEKNGFSDTRSLERTLEYMNEVQRDIADHGSWPTFKFKMKKLVAAGTQELDVSPQVPSAPVLAALAGGSLPTATAYRVKTTFVLFDEGGQEMYSLESEPSAQSNEITTAGTDLSLTVSAIDTYDGVATVVPTTIHRRIYLKKATGDWLLAKTLEDNTTTTTTITADTTSVIEPPTESMIKELSPEDPTIDSSGRSLRENNLNDILRYDPFNTSRGTPEAYARTGKTKIRLYPPPSTAITLSYWVYRYPCRIFADTARVVQLPESLKPVFDAGVTWKFYEYKDSDGQESKLANYEGLKVKFLGKYAAPSGQFGTIKRVC